MRYRFYIMIALVAILGFFAFAPWTEVNKHSITELAKVSGMFLAFGLGIVLMSLAAITKAEKKDVAFFEHLMVLGLVMGVFGLGTMPFSESKIAIVPVIGLSAFALSLIVTNMRPAKHAGLQALPIFLASISGPASMWALATGWGFWSSTLLLGVGLVVSAYLSRLQPVESAFQAPADSATSGARASTIV